MYQGEHIEKKKKQSKGLMFFSRYLAVAEGTGPRLHSVASLQPPSLGPVQVHPVLP
jgi:hypothetical protein